MQHLAYHRTPVQFRHFTADHVQPIFTFSANIADGLQSHRGFAFIRCVPDSQQKRGNTIEQSSCAGGQREHAFCFSEAPLPAGRYRPAGGIGCCRRVSTDGGRLADRAVEQLQQALPVLFVSTRPVGQRRTGDPNGLLRSHGCMQQGQSHSPRFPHCPITSWQCERPQPGNSTKPGRCAAQDLTAPDGAVRSVPRPVKGNPQHLTVQPLLFNHSGDHMCMMVLDRNRLTALLPGPLRRKQVRMQVVSDHRRPQLIQRTQLVDLLHKPLTYRQRIQIANVRSEHCLTAAGKSNGGFLVSTHGQNRPGRTDLQWKRCQTPRTANRHRAPGDQADHAVVDRPDDPSIVTQDGICHGWHRVLTRLVAIVERLAAHIPAGHHARSSTAIKQQLVQRRRRQHDSDLIQMRGNTRRQPRRIA